MAFNGQLNVNHIQSALFNMIISQDVIGGKINNNYNLVDKARVDGTLYGDTKLYIDTPTLTSVAWTQDGSDELNLLATHRPPAPKVQAITMGVYRQVRLTSDDYLSKQAFGTEGAFTSYQSTLQSRLNKTKEVYDNTTYNAFFGTVDPVKSEEIRLTIDDSTTANSVEATRINAEAIAQKLADIIADMKDYGYEYTKNGFLRAFSDSDIHVVWNVKYINMIRKISLPNIYHGENLVDKFGEDQLPSRYFGSVNESEIAGDGEKVRSLIEQFIGENHYFAGELIKTTDVAPAGTSYTQSDAVICKIYTKLPPYMSAFNVGTSFFNAKNLSTNQYQTFGHNKLAALDSEALVVLKKAE